MSETSEAPETGDRPLKPGSPPILIDMSREPDVPAPEGDRHVPGSVILVRDDQRPPPTAADYRAAGYVVPDQAEGPVPDDQAPGLVYADRHAPQGTVSLVASTSEPPPESPAPEPAEEEAEPEQDPDEPQQADEEQPPEEEPSEAKPAQGRRSPEAAAEQDGREAARAGKPRTDNPHDRRTTEGKAWDRGWNEAKPDA